MLRQKRNRPSYIKAADYKKAKQMYNQTIIQFETVLKEKFQLESLELTWKFRWLIMAQLQ